MDMCLYIYCLGSI